MAKAALPVPAPRAETIEISFFDPSDLGPISACPLVPVEILEKHKALVPTDARFRSAARLLQCLWREDHDLPIGSYVNGDGKRTRLGSRITSIAGRTGANFLSPAIAVLVRRECVFRELGALIEVDRLRDNLLSSMPLCFNLFAPLKLDLLLATRFVAELFPGFMDSVTAIRFEHSPGRGDPRYTADYSAFDLSIYGKTATGKRAFAAFEVKYSETGTEPAPERFSSRHAVISEAAGLLKEPEDPTLFLSPTQQLWREHNLAQSILDNDRADVGIFVLLAPGLNHLAQQMGQIYASKLAPTEDGRVPFVSISLERVIEALAMIGLVEHAQALHRRYLDFWQIDGELELEEFVPTVHATSVSEAAQTA
jgi:hypothetical protein